MISRVAFIGKASAKVSSTMTPLIFIGSRHRNLVDDDPSPILVRDLIVPDDHVLYAHCVVPLEIRLQGALDSALVARSDGGG
jgi:hypothetical protein